MSRAEKLTGSAFVTGEQKKGLLRRAIGTIGDKIVKVQSARAQRMIFEMTGRQSEEINKYYAERLDQTR